MSRVVLNIAAEASSPQKLQHMESIVEDGLYEAHHIAQSWSTSHHAIVAKSPETLTVLIVDMAEESEQWLEYWYAQYITRVHHNFSERAITTDNNDAALGNDSSMSHYNNAAVCIFSSRGWQQIVSVLPTPGELWRYLTYYRDTLYQNAFAQSELGQNASPLETHYQVKSDQNQPENRAQISLLHYLSGLALFSPAIAVDNALIKYRLRESPNSQLVAMAQRQLTVSPSTKAHSFSSAQPPSLLTPDFNAALLTKDQRHLVNAAALWSQLCLQMMPITNSQDQRALSGSQIDNEWLKQLLDESLYSRYELVAELYRFPQQPNDKRQSGYVVHQHSYESLGRHYVMIFYGESETALHQKKVIQPKLADIANDVVSRLPIGELHHIVVLGIGFVKQEAETFIELDAYVQAVTPMTARERQLTRQLQQRRNA